MTLKSNFKFYLTDKLNSGATTVTIGNDVETDSSVELSTATSIVIRHPDKADVIERITATATGGTLTTSARGLSNANPAVAASSREQDRRPGAICYVTFFPEDVLEKDATDTVTGDITFSGDVVFSGSRREPVYADATARDAAITSPTNGMGGIYNTATGKYQDYTAGSWVDRESGGTFANASTTVAGKTEESTAAQHTAGTATGETGAQLFSTPDVIQASIQSGEALYAGASAVGTDSYAVTMTPVLASYTTGQRLSFKADVANTATATVDFGPSALTMVSRSGDVLITGDILANDIVEGYYDGTNFVIDNIISSIGYLAGDYKYIFGDGSDGDVTISANTTLTADMYYNNLTIDSTKVLSPDGYKIYVKGTLTNNGIIRRNGNDGGDGGAASSGVGGTAGAAGAALNAGTLGDSVAGGAGGVGRTGSSAGDPGDAGGASNPSYTDTDGSAGGNGGDANGGGANVAGGAGGISTQGTYYNTVYSLSQIMSQLTNPASSSITSLTAFLNDTLYKGQPGGGGGGSGDTETGADASGGGGGGASAGGVIWIAARIIDNTNGVIESIGGDGGDAGAGFEGGGNDWGGSGGGAGGNGGIIYLIYKTLTAIGTTTLTGGAGGAFTVGSGGTGDDGAAGNAGSTGDLIQITV